MKKYIATLVSILILGLAVNFSSAEEASSESSYPDIQFEERTYDFGAAGQQEKIVHEYRFKNTGKETLVIKSVNSSCGCIAEILSPKTIPAGENGSIKVTFETRRYRGKQAKSIFVETNDPDEPEIELEISGMIKTEVAVVPEFLYFGDIEKGKTLTKEIKLIQIGNEELNLEKVEVSANYLSAGVSNLEDERHRGFKIKVGLNSDTPPVGKFAEVITLHTNFRERPRIDVPVAGNILGRIRVKPQALSLGSMKKGGIASQKVEVATADETAFRIINVEAGLPFISTEIYKVEKRFEITLKVDENAPAGRLEGKISIQTDDPEQLLIKVPFYGVIEKEIFKE
ncbi:MAG: DUF1573 domain-containing protein [bacterium]|nr:DUF1573 domain-containing protein [bacterium]